MPLTNEHALELAESYVNGNLSTVRDEIRNSPDPAKLAIEVFRELKFAKTESVRFTLWVSGWDDLPKQGRVIAENMKKHL